jgi:predicted transcriptional regulator
MRAYVDLDDEQVWELDRLARSQKRSRAALIRQAVTDYLQAWKRETAENSFGLWCGRKVDGLTYQERVRSEW